MSHKGDRNKKLDTLSRRDFLKKAGVVLGGATFISLPFAAACGNISKIFTSSNATLPSVTTTKPSTNNPQTSLTPVSSSPATSFTFPTATSIPNLFDLSLTASSSSGKPANVSGYTVSDRMFIDWHLADQTRWFRWGRKSSGTVRLLWQVSMMPFDNSTVTALNPPGLVASGVLESRSSEFSVNFAKFLPGPNLVKANLSNASFYTVVKQNSYMPSWSAFNVPSSRGVLTLNTAISSRISSVSNLNSGKVSLLKNYNSTLGNPSSIQTPDFSKPVVVSDANQSALKSVLEATGTVKQYNYYIRVVALDASDNPVGTPSNTIVALCGDPIFEKDISVLPQMLRAQLFGTGDFQYSAIFNLDWTTGAALNKKFIAPFTDTKDYGYTYFQVTAENVDPNRLSALHPPGLAATVISSELGNDNLGAKGVIAQIDFRNFAPAADAKNPVQIRYFVRAIHVYSDTANPGYARLVFSPPAIVNYGDPKAIAYQNPYLVNVDIGSPSVRFVTYSPPYFGDNPSDHVIVTQVPGAPFDWLKVGEQRTVSGLRDWLLDQNRNKDNSVLNMLIQGFNGLFGGIAKLINSVSQAWSQIQSAVVAGLASVGIPPVIGGMLLNAALMAAGVPPTLPNFDDLSNMASGELADMLVEQSGGIVPSDVAKAAVNQVVDQAKKVAASTIAGLNGDLSVLNGCLKPDTSYVWKPAIISLELYNPLKTQIPSGNFLLRFVESTDFSVTPTSKSYFYPQTVSYPPVPAGQKVSLAIPLDEACYKVIGGGEKHFPEDYSGGTDDTTWNKLILGHKQLSALVTDIQPNIPDPGDFEKELGMGGIVFIHLNILPSVLNVRRDLSGIKTAWASGSDDRFPGMVYVSTTGSDTGTGSYYHPYKTLDKAFSVSVSNDAILLEPGTYQASNLSVTNPGQSIGGIAPGVIIKAGTGVDYCFNVGSKANDFTIRGIELDGGLSINGVSAVKLEDLRILNPRSVGLQMNNCQNAAITRCEVGKSGTTSANPTLGVNLNNCYAFSMTDCSIHNITNGTGLQISNGSLGSVKNSVVSFCLTGISLGGTGNTVDNCFIHDTDLSGVTFVGSTNCSLTRCTLKDTALDELYGFAPLYFDFGTGAPNSVTLVQSQNLGYFPQVYYAQYCVFSEKGHNNDIAMVNASSDLTKVGISKNQQPYISDNIYYSALGKVRMVDLRNNKYYQFTPAATMPPGINSFAWADIAIDRNSKELDPKIDILGHSAVPDCLGEGVQ